MQPYFLPYIGYYQLINSVDEFVIYDNIEYTKKGWINRNRILMDGQAKYLTIPIKRDSDYLQISERNLAKSFKDERFMLYNKIESLYDKAPFVNQTMPIIREIIFFDEENLFCFLLNGLKITLDYLEIRTPITIYSNIDMNHNLKGKERVMAICKRFKATKYINPIGGIDLYSREEFQINQIELLFLKSEMITYAQYENNFVPWLSIIDVMMFNPREKVQSFLLEYNLI